LLQNREQESSDIYGEMNCEVYILPLMRIIESMRRSNTVRIIAGKGTKAKLTSIGKAQPVVYRWSGVGNH